ncbi:hypothetical protein NE236_32690 [Actinoallomurus purpureus]|uniref:hypothetical protein n=1 Tax=Actinoallomurus purpureus TaxID=478114 RepID=UPI002091FC14|nr:hypothetical protein [Actinoallomurus purpureus]MCO6009739.1 hypothetical protein [Actinoallomurus purpureus]
MAIEINDDSMSAEAAGTVIATATRAGDRWAVSTWPDALTRNQAITALTLAEWLATGHGDDDPFTIAWRTKPQGPSYFANRLTAGISRTPSA